MGISGSEAGWMRRRRRGAGDPTAVRCECARADAVRAVLTIWRSISLRTASATASESTMGIASTNRLSWGAESVQAAYITLGKEIAAATFALAKNKVYLVDLYRLCLLSPPSTQP